MGGDTVRLLIALLCFTWSLIAAPIHAQTIPVYTFATLPASPTAGQLAWVTDGGATPIQGTPEIGGGTHRDLVSYDATQTRWEFVQRAPDDTPPEELPTFLSADRVAFDGASAGSASDDVQEALDELFGGGGGGGGGGDNLGNGQATGDLDLNGHDLLEVGAATLSGDTLNKHTVDRRTYIGPAHARANYLRSWFAIDGSGSGTKTSTVSLESEFVNLTSSQAFNAWLTSIGGGATDLVGLELDTFHTGPCSNSGDECLQAVRAQSSDVYFTGAGSFTGSIPAGAGTTTLTIPANSMSGTSSKVVGEEKLLVLESHPSAATVTIVDAPPATNVGGTIEAGWTGTGNGAGEGVWTLSPGQVPANAVGWCFSANAANYTDLAGTTTRHWLYITASNSGANQITTEWNAQGVNQRVPYGYQVSLATSGAKIAPCPKVVDVDQGTDYVTDTITVATGSGFPGASAQSFVVGAYGLHQIVGYRQLIENKLGHAIPGRGFIAANRLETNRSRYQGLSAYSATFVGDLANLVDGKKSAFKYGFDCDKIGACDAALHFPYGATSGQGDWLSEIDVPALRWTTTPENLIVLRVNPDSSQNITIHPTLGLGRNGDPFMRSAQLNTPNGSGPTTASSGRLVEWSQIEGMPAGFQDGSDDGGAGGATDLNGLTDVVLTTPVNSQALIYNGTNWVNAALNLSNPAALSGTLPDSNVSDSITAVNYLPLAGGTLTGSLTLSSGQGITIPTGAVIQPTGTGANFATNYAGSGSTTSAVDLGTAEVNGTNLVANGGTGAGNFTNGGLLLGSGFGALRSTGVLAAGQMLIGDGTTDPTVAAMSGDATMTSGGVVAFASGSVDANELVSTGVSPGTYQNANVTVDADGRVTAISAGSSLVIASGTKALATTSISAGACNSDSITAAGVVSTDVVTWSPNADLSAVVGYRPISGDGLAIYPPVPSAGSILVKVCNPTASSITPGALSLNYRVVR